MAFGVGVGLTEGIGKASEFFAGYELECLLFVYENILIVLVIF